MKTLTIADETSFKRMLCLERKRSERTGDPFLLVLLEGDATVMEKVGPMIATAVRDTDVTGWYRSNVTLGMIFTALHGSSRENIKAAIYSRVMSAPSSNLRPDQIRRLVLSFHFFPEENGAGASFTKSDRALYPDLDMENLSRKLSEVSKRAIDIAGSLIALIVLSPLFMLIAAGIKMTSAGPVLFRQKRLGKDGVEFTFLKFRSMYVANDPHIHRQYVQDLIGSKSRDAGGVYKIQHDPRVTRFGRLLRVSSLDELPQFMNVLTGTMSLVGPRPPIGYEFDCYRPWHRQRVLGTKPGITGVWQVNGRSRTTFDEMVRMDLRYVRNRSLWVDLKILLKTPLVVISREGAY